MGGRLPRSARGRRVLLALLLSLCAPTFARGGETTAAGRDIAREAGALSAAARRPNAPRDPDSLGSASDRVGELVVRARASDADAAVFRALADAGEALAGLVEGKRRELESAAGDDEAALEAVLRSQDWQRLRYAAATLEHWNAWSRLELAARLPVGSAERGTLADRAASAFARSSRSLAVPGLASASLLGLGLARLERGDLTSAQEALGRLEEQLDRGEATEALRAPLLRALVQLQVRRGALDRAVQMASRIPAESLSAGEREWLRSLGSLLAAEKALAGARYGEARDLYAAVLDDPAPQLGLDLRGARYGYAVALHETGRLEQAAEQLDRVLSDPPSEQTARGAALLRFAIAERLLRDEATPRHHALAASAGAQVLRYAADAVQADAARMRVARESEGARRPETALAQLARVDPAGPTYPAALWDRIRLRATQLEADAARDRAPDRSQAERLAADIDEARRLAEQGRLALDDAGSATLAVLRAESALWSGVPGAETLAWIQRARSEAGMDAEARRALLAVELRVLVDSADSAGFSSLLAARDDAAVRRDFAPLYAALLDLEERGAPAALRVAAYTRLAREAPAAEQPAVELALARAWLDSGDAGEAARRARGLVEADRAWGDAWRVYADALDAGGDASAAASAWRVLSEGVEPGSAPWRDAQLGLLRALQRAGDAKAGCEVARQLGDASSLDADARAEVGRAVAGCGPRGAQGAGKP